MPLEALRGVRSIPACAGEARARAYRRELAGVYPRVCGGSLSSSGAYSLADGLSPRVRGKHADQRG